MSSYRHILRIHLFTLRWSVILPPAVLPTWTTIYFTRNSYMGGSRHSHPHWKYEGTQSCAFSLGNVLNPGFYSIQMGSTMWRNWCHCNFVVTNRPVCAAVNGGNDFRCPSFSVGTLKIIQFSAAEVKVKCYTVYACCWSVQVLHISSWESWSVLFVDHRPPESIRLFFFFSFCVEIYVSWLQMNPSILVYFLNS